MAARPTASVVVPFRGPQAKLDALLTRLAVLQLAPGDELIVADNRDSGRDRSHYATDPSQSGVQMVGAAGIASPGYARNRGAEQATGAWLVFIDADTEPAPDLLTGYFATKPHAATAILAGAILDVLPPGRATLSARHSVARAHMDQATTLARPNFPYAQSANVAIRRDAFRDVSGFDERARAGEDADLCFRLMRAGYGLETRPGAKLSHRARGTLRASLRQLARHGAGAAWCNERYPGSFPPPTPRQFGARIARSAQQAGRGLRAGDRQAAGFGLLEIAEATAFEFGRLLPNSA